MAPKKKKTKAVKRAKKPAKKAVKKAKPKAKVKAKAKAKAKTTPAAKASKPAPKNAKAAAKTAARAAKKKAKAAGKQKDPILPWRSPLPGETLVGVVDDYYAKIGVITLNVVAPVKTGEKIHVRGHTTDLAQTIDSMQCDHDAVESAKAGMGIGIKVEEIVRKGDYVYRVSES